MKKVLLGIMCSVLFLFFSSNAYADETNGTTNSSISSSVENINDDDITIDEYEQNISKIKRVSVSEVERILSVRDNQEYLLYFGRPTCYYCRQFSSTMKEFNALVDNKLEYLDLDAEPGAMELAFKTIGIPGTPAILRLKNGQGVSGWIGTGVTAQEMYDFIYSEESNKRSQELDIN